MPGYLPPEQPLRLDRSSEFIKGLLACYVPRRSGTVIDLTEQHGPGTGIIDYGRYGLSARDFTTVGSISDLQLTSGPYTFACLLNRKNTGTNGEFATVLGNFLYVSESNNQGWALQVRGGSGFAWGFESLRNNSTADGQGTFITNNNIGIGDHLVVCTSNGVNTRTLYTDGVFAATNSVNINPVSSTGPLFNASTTNVKNPIYYGMVWNRELTASEVAGLWISGTRHIHARRNRVGWTETVLGSNWKVQNTYKNQVLADTPVSYWKLDEISGTSAADTAATNTGTYTRTSALTLGKLSFGSDTATSVLFAGGTTSGYVTVPTTSALELSGDHTLEAIFKTSSSGTEQRIVNKINTSGPFDGYGLRVSSTGKVGYWVGDNWQETTLSYNDGKFHHVVGTLSGTTGTIYVDGQPVSTATRSPSLSYGGSRAYTDATISGPTSTTPSGTFTKSSDLAPSSGGTSYAVAMYDSGLYLLKKVKGTLQSTVTHTTITGPVSSTPTATFTKTSNVTGVTSVVTGLNSGRYIFKQVTSMSRINPAPNLVIGTDNAFLSGFNGNIDEVAIYNYALSPYRAFVHYQQLYFSAVRLSQIGLLSIEQGSPADRVSQTSTLTIQVGTPNDRISQVAVLTIQLFTPPDRVSQSGILVVDTGTPPDRVSQSGLLAVEVGTPKDNISQSGVLVVYGTDKIICPATLLHCM